MHIVWFKRDLRIEDHAPLHHAAQHGALLPLYILEPALWSEPDMSHRHYCFLQTTLAALDTALQACGQPLSIAVGDALTILQKLHATYGIEALYSHEETWNDWTYQRDKAIKSWLKDQGIVWHEYQRNGVIRALKKRDGWAAKWHAHMKQTIIAPPQRLQGIDLPSDPLPSPQALGLADDGCHQPQLGGRQAALSTLHTFLSKRGANYGKAMSSPRTAFEQCSRLSPYLAFGVLSMREVWQATEQQKQTVRLQSKEARGTWLRDLQAFSSRLRWHCHFMQKLEDQPSIEFSNFHSAYNALRQEPLDGKKFSAWQTGHTGYPMIDACMRALITTGWINFRMRAMLVSFASYHLWLDWRQPALHLARLFTDYEPGIHYAQIQMQSGTTGINTLRIYNPIKQSMDHDPDGIFIKKWLPELANMPLKYIHTPWLHPSAMGDYPMPIVDEKTARAHARDALYGIRKHQGHKKEASGIVHKHGSRKKPRTPQKSKRQKELPL